MEFAAAVLVGVEDGSQLNSHNGLPVTPSPTRMLSRFWRLTAIHHPNLCRYFELIRCQSATNAVVLISEHYNRKYVDEFLSEDFDEPLAYRVIGELCAGVRACHDCRVLVGLITLDNILLHTIDQDVHVKLTQYGLYHVSGNNADVEHLIGSAWYLAPERLLTRPPPPSTRKNVDGSQPELRGHTALATYKSDVWALGIVILEIFLRQRLSDVWGVRQFLSVLRSVIEKADCESALVPLLDSIRVACPSKKIAMPNEIFGIIAGCLQILPSRRPNIITLQQMISEVTLVSGSDRQTGDMRRLDESIEEMNERLRRLQKFDPDFNHYYGRPLGERYFLWKLCGSGVENILISRGVIRMKSPICTVPILVVDDFQFFGNEDARKVSTTYDLCVLPSQNVKERLWQLHGRDTYQSVELTKALAAVRPSNERRNREVRRSAVGETFDWQNINAQTLVVKERDIDYQAFRMRLFAKLLAANTYSADILRAEARKDIPPHYRAAVWAALLDVEAKAALEEFTRLDTFSEHVSDRQLCVDIPRCHQYDELMTSPAAHYKLKVLLKAWLVASSRNASGYVYWQGLDSLATPFLVLNFNEIRSLFSALIASVYEIKCGQSFPLLDIAYKCLREFIERYLHNFFLQDNSDTIQEYLSVFMLLVEFIDPDLAAHLMALEFPPQLFAIPWFLTCFVHILPLHKLFHLWDSLLMADASFPLFIGVAILTQLRPQLITAQFNDAILLFSDLPDLPIDQVVSDSNKFYSSVPASCTHSEHNSARHCVPNLREMLVQLIASSSRLAAMGSAAKNTLTDVQYSG